MIEKMVRCGAPTTCSTCGLDIDAHDVALRRSSRAVTYHERCHMDGRWMVHRYHHPKCREPENNGAGQAVAQAAKEQR